MDEKDGWPTRDLLVRQVALWSVFGAFWALGIMRSALADAGAVPAKTVLLAIVSGVCFAGSLVCLAALVSPSSRSYRGLNRLGRARVDAALAFGFPDEAQPFRRIERDLARALDRPKRALVIGYCVLVAAVSAWLIAVSPRPAWFVALVLLVAAAAVAALTVFHRNRHHLALLAVRINTADDPE